jgi:glycosyltransferase involved in cell wall biosynthesis
MTSAVKKILIINYYLKIGGVETLLEKLIPKFVEKKIEVTLLLIKSMADSEIENELKKYCKILYLNNLVPYNKNKLLNSLDQNIDIIFCTVPQALIWACYIRKTANLKNSKIILGAYQTDLFCNVPKWFDFHKKILKKYITRRVNYKNIVFPNTASRETHANRLSHNYMNSPIINLFVDTSKYHFRNKDKCPRNVIVSVGRIVDFKTYNFTMVSVIKELIDKNYNIEWRVYGDGPQFDKLKNLVINEDLKNNILLFGNLDYSKFESVMSDAFLFVGSGISLLEAAACGVPALATIEYSNEPITYGFIGEIEGNSFIEPNIKMKKYLLINKITQLIEANLEDYKLQQLSCYKKLRDFNDKNIVDKYVEAFNKAEKIKGFGLPTLIIYYFGGFISYACKKLLPNGF